VICPQSVYLQENSTAIVNHSTTINQTFIPPITERPILGDHNVTNYAIPYVTESFYQTQQNQFSNGTQIWNTTEPLVTGQPDFSGNHTGLSVNTTMAVNVVSIESNFTTVTENMTSVTELMEHDRTIGMADNVTVATQLVTEEMEGVTKYPEFMEDVTTPAWFEEGPTTKEGNNQSKGH